MLRQMVHKALNPIEYGRRSTIGTTKDASKGSPGRVWFTCVIRDMGLEHKLPAELYPFHELEDSRVITILLPVDRYQSTLEFAMFALLILGLIIHAPWPYPLLHSSFGVADLLPPSTFAETGKIVHLAWQQIHGIVGVECWI